MHMFIDEGKDGPRLFSFQPLEKKTLDTPNWISQKFQLTLWCEHSRLPLPLLNEYKNDRGIYILDIPKDWLVKAAPLFKKVVGTLSLLLPIACSVTNLIIDESSYNKIEKELELGRECLDFTLNSIDRSINSYYENDFHEKINGDLYAEGPVLRELHSFLAKTDPSFGGLERVINGRGEFMWVHPKYKNEY